MKSFNQHITKDREKLDENLNEKKDEKLLEDLTDLVWAAAAGAGLFAVSKAWDKWGKDAAASLPFATKKMKTAKAQRAIDKDDEKTKDKETHAKAAALGYEKDGDGNIKNQEDAQEYRDETKSAPEGWATSDGKTPEGAVPKPEKGTVWTKDEEEKWTEDEAKRKEDIAAKKAADDAAADAKTDTKTDSSLGKVDKDKQAALKAKLIAKRKAAGKDVSKFEALQEFYMFAKDELTSLSEENRTQLLKELILEETMTITESNELQAIMALGDEGIDAEINRKGQVVVKKKDLKKAQKALKKSFKKGGEPKLVGEELHRTAYEVVSEARTKVIKNKPKWEPEDSEPRLS